MTQPLSTVLADWHSVAKAHERTGDMRMCETIQKMCRDVASAAEDWLTFLPESDAMLRSGHAERWFRSRFGDWEAQGHAEKRGKTRFYRACMVPQRGNPSVAFEEGRRAAREDAA